MLSMGERDSFSSGDSRAWGSLGLIRPRISWLVVSLGQARELVLVRVNLNGEMGSQGGSRAGPDLLFSKKHS